jgi:S1-C subfamily serine protease
MSMHMSSSPSRSARRSPAAYVRLAAGIAGGLAAGITTLAAPASAATGAGGPDPDAGPPSEQVAPLVQPSVVYEAVTWKGYVYDTYNRQYLKLEEFTVPTQCTGFVVNPDGWVATAGHCVDPTSGKEAVRRAAATWALENGYYTSSFGLTVEDVMKSYRVDILDDGGQVSRNKVDRKVTVSWGASVSGVDVQKRHAARVVDFQSFDEGDGALLKVDARDLNAIELAETDGVEINSGVVAVGYPAIIRAFTDPDLTPTFDAGAVSSIKTVADGLLSVFQLSAELSGGMSGGPTVDQAGNVIGVNSARLVGEPFNYAVPAERIAELLAGAGVENTVSPTTLTYREGIRAYFAGDRELAVTSLEKVLDEQPANGLAEKYLAKAERLPKPAPAPASDDGFPTWVLVGGGAAVAVTIGGGGLVAVLLRRRGRRAAPAPGPGSAGGHPGFPGAPVPPMPAAAQPFSEQPFSEQRPAPEQVLVGAGAPMPAHAVPSQPVSLPEPPAPPAPVGFVSQAPSYAASAAGACPTCGHPVEAGMAFCGRCGTRTGGAA